MRGLFTALDLPAGRARVRPEAEAWVRGVLGEGGTLFEEAASDPDRIELRGRGPAWAIPAPGPARGGGRWLVRHYRRGGAVGPLLGDRYLRLGTPRPLRELAASEAVRARGVETPRVMAAAVYPSGPLYRGDLVTEFVEDARDLAGVLFSDSALRHEGDAERRPALVAAGDLVRRLAEAGIHHRDLNAKNVLLARDGDALRALVLDLDRCRLAAPGSAVRPGPMLERLLRSLDKLGTSTGRGLAPEEREALIRATGTRDAP